MKNFTNKICFAVIISFSMFILSSSIYANTEVKEVTVSCPTCSPSPWVTLDENNPNSYRTHYTLKTKGMRVPGRKELVTDWFDYVMDDDNAPSTATVMATCGSVSNNNWVHMMIEEDVSNIKPLVCAEKGKLISVSVMKPKCQEVGKYVYVGELIKKIDDDEGKVVSTVSVPINSSCNSGSVSGLLKQDSNVNKGFMFNHVK